MSSQTSESHKKGDGLFTCFFPSGISFGRTKEQMELQQLEADDLFPPLSRPLLGFLIGGCAPTSMKNMLYTRAASSCSFRVRIALNLKGLTCDFLPVVARDQSAEYFRKVNPQRLVPVLVNGDDRICQSLAILEYLEEKFGPPSLLPRDPAGRARVRAISQYVVSDIQPLQNTGIDAQLERWKVDAMQWKQYFIERGFSALEDMLVSVAQPGKYCHGDSPTMADCCLVPQVWNAVNRYDVDMSAYPTIEAVYKNCVQLPAVDAAMPEKQSDYMPPTD